MRIPVFIFAIAALVVAACGGSSSTPAPTPTAPPIVAPTATPDPFAAVPGVVDAANHGWPREVQGTNGRVSIKAKPQRIVTLSVGHDELTYALVPASRVVAVGSSSKIALYSNVAELAQGVPTIGAEPEAVLAQRPDIMVTSPFIKKEVVEALARTGLTVVQTSPSNADARSRVNDILLLGYIYGEEARAVELAAEVQRRSEAVAAVVSGKPAQGRPRVLSTARFSNKIYVAGRGSTEGNIIAAAGGVNAAAEADIDQYPAVSIESIIAIKPEVIILTQSSQDGGDEYRKDLMSNPALAEVPAIKSGRVYLMGTRYFTTLSFWNVRGIEELAKALWPSDFAGREFGPFSLPRSG